MAIAEQDALIVDLVVGGLSPSDAAIEAEGRMIDARRLAAVTRFLKLMKSSPTIEPPKDLVERTLRRIEDAS